MSEPQAGQGTSSPTPAPSISQTDTSLLPYLVYEVKDLGEDMSTFPGVDRGLVKYTGLKEAIQGHYPMPLGICKV